MTKLLFLFPMYLIFSCEPQTRIDTKEPLKMTADTKDKTEYGVTEQDIYAFMQILIKEQKLNTSYGLQLSPEQSASISGNDSIYLNQLLQDTTKLQDTIAIELLENEKVEWQLIPKTQQYKIDIPSVLTPADVSFMHQQRKRLPTFTWDNTQLGFNMNNTQHWYSFSVPLFSKDKCKVIILVQNLCAGLCGSGCNYLFSKNDKGEWTCQTGMMWLH